MLVAIIDGSGADATVGLYQEDHKGDLRPFPWPDHWPMSVSAKVLGEMGVKVVRA